MPDAFNFRFIKHHRQMLQCEQDILFRAQREILRVGGSLALTEDLEFIVAAGEHWPVGILAIRDEYDGRWIQMLYAHPEHRRKQVAASLIGEAIRMWPDKKFGLATRNTNAPMLALAKKLGFTNEVQYFWREPSRG